MKLSPFVIGVISAQGSGDYDYGTGDDDRHVYAGSSFGGSAWNYGSAGRSGTPASAVTCWESNNMGTHGTVNGNHNNHLLNSVDEFGWANVHNGHQTSQGTINVVGSNEFSGATVGQDYHSELAFDHRLSGCIYEITGWAFTADSYNKVHSMAYGTLFNGIGYDDPNGDIFPVWWHYFNAHVLPGGSTHAHDLVMANPTYEGLGYLNYIVTFLAGDKSGTERNPETNDNNIADGMHTDLYSNGDQFALTIRGASTSCGYTDLGAASGCYMSKYTQSVSATDWAFIQFAVSSFPHNDLGKDFRFNLRMMHHLGEGDSFEFFDSYYFYRVNTITITFPTTVSCPYTLTTGDVVMHQCMDSAGAHGQQMHDGNFGNPQVNVPAYVESLTDANNFVGGGKFGEICDNAGSPAIGTHRCGNVYSVSGLMNMYDEYAQQEYGTHQEVWFQFYYKYSTTGITGLDDANTGVYNSPNKLFNAFEIASITGACDSTNLFNANTCVGGANDGVAEETWSENVQSG